MYIPGPDKGLLVYVHGQVAYGTVICVYVWPPSIQTTGNGAKQLSIRVLLSP